MEIVELMELKSPNPTEKVIMSSLIEKKRDVWNYIPK